MRRRRYGLVAGALLAGLALTGCTAAPADTASPSPEATSATPAPTAASSASPSPSTPPTPSETTAAAAESVTIDITIADGEVTPNGEKIDVEVGQPIVLHVSSDEADEIHAHTDERDGYELEVGAGEKASGQFTLDSPGSYEVESHHLGKTIVILNAR